MLDDKTSLTLNNTAFSAFPKRFQPAQPGFYTWIPASDFPTVSLYTKGLRKRKASDPRSCTKLHWGCQT